MPYNTVFIMTWTETKCYYQLFIINLCDCWSGNFYKQEPPKALKHGHKCGLKLNPCVIKLYNHTRLSINFTVSIYSNMFVVWCLLQLKLELVGIFTRSDFHNVPLKSIIIIPGKES